MKQVVRIVKGPGSTKAVTLDTGEVFTIDEGLCQERLRVKAQLTDEDIQRLIEDSETVQAASRAMWCLSCRDYGERELARRLMVRNGYSERAANAAVEVVKDFGFMDDRGYAARVAERYFSKGKSRLRVEAELRKRELDPELIREVLDEVEPNPREQLRALILEKNEQAQLQTDAGVAKAAHHYMRAGFRLSDIRAAIREFNPHTEFFR